MKIGKEEIPGLVMKQLASGRFYFGWEPSPKLRRVGWKTRKFDVDDLVAAIPLARAENAKVAKWKEGGERPRQVRAYSAPATFNALLDAYEREKLVSLRASTQRVDGSQIKKLREWAGKHPVGYITRARVRALKLAICPEADSVRRLIDEGVRDIRGHNQAFKLLCKGREVFSWAIRRAEPLATTNPFEAFELAKPPPRDAIWEPDALDAFTTSAHALGWPSIGFALRLACNFGQREGDILALTVPMWREISLRQLRMDREMRDALKSEHGPDAGKVMGFYVETGKTRRWVGVPIAGETRDEVEAAIAAAQARAEEARRAAAAAGKPIPLAALRIVTRESWRGDSKSTTIWSQRDFIEHFGEIRAHAAEAARAAGNAELADRLDHLEFRDSRRTCVVTLGELGMDDAAISARTTHSLATIKSMLEIYMPRTEAMAGRGTVAMLEAHARRREVPAEAKEKQG